MIRIRVRVTIRARDKIRVTVRFRDIIRVMGLLILRTNI